MSPESRDGAASEKATSLESCETELQVLARLRPGEKATRSIEGGELRCWMLERADDLGRQEADVLAIHRGRREGIPSRSGNVGDFSVAFLNSGGL